MPPTDLRHLNKNWKCWFSRKSKRWVPGEKPLWAENSLRNRHSEGKVKGTSDAREAKVRETGDGTSPPFSLAREFPSPFLSNPCLSGWVGERTQNKLSPHIASPRGLEPGGRRVLSPPYHDGYFLFLNSPIGSFFLVLFFVSHWVWRSHRLFSEEILMKRKNIFVLAAARVKLFKTTRNKSFCLFADLFSL